MLQAAGLAAWAALAVAQVPRMVVDLNTARVASAPAGFVESRGITYFSAHEGRTGRELWRSDGTVAGTRIVADLCPGSCSSSPDALTDLGGELHFAASVGGGLAREMWRSDGTAAGTLLAAAPSERSRRWDRIAAIAGEPGRVWFVALEGPAARLWLSDGTPAGTTELAGLASVWPADCVSRIVALGGNAVALVQSARNGKSALHGSDGTAAGTRNLCWDCVELDPRMVVLGSRMLYSESNGLWASDGTRDGTRLLFEFSAPPGWLTALGSQVLFAATTDFMDRELWRTDGTAEGTRRVADIYPGPLGSLPEQLVRLGDRVVFAARDDGSPTQLWTSDGTGSGTRRVARTSGDAGIAPFGLTASQGLVFYRAYAPGHGYELWRSDITPWGSWMVRELAAGLADAALEEVTATASGAYFRRDDGDGAELWHSDGGTPSGTRELLRINETSNQGSDPRAIAAVGQRALLTSSNGSGLWSSDGTVASHESLQFDGGWPFLFAAWPGGIAHATYRGRFYYTICCRPSSSIPSGSYTASTDGTQAGIQVLDERDPGGSPPYIPRRFLAAGSRLFYTGEREVWHTDGTPGGTHAAQPPTSLDHAESFGHRIVFWGWDGRRYEPWIGDGTSAGTVQLAHTSNQARESWSLLRPGVQGGQAWFAAVSPASSVHELWASDGTPAGTSYRTTLPEKARELARVQPAGGLLYRADDRAGRPRLWRTDGTATGTAAIADLCGGCAAHALRADYAALGDDVLFAGHDPATGRELWRSDGVTAWPVADLCTPDCDGDPQAFAAFDGEVFFSAVDFAGGRELWRTDGTAAGTRRVADIAPGPYGSDPDTLVAAEHRLFFGADDGLHGRELWVLEGRGGPALLRGQGLPLESPRDRYLAPAFPGLDPDSLAVSDSYRPLLFYRLDAAAVTLRLAKTATRRVRFAY